MDCVALVEKVVDEVITPTPPPPPDEHQGHQMVRWSIGSAALVAINGGLGLQDPPWINTQPLPPGNNNTSPYHSPVLLTLADARDFVEVMAPRGRRMTTCLTAVPPPFITIPPATATFFPPDFGNLDSKHNSTTLPDNEAHLHTVGVTAPWMHPDMIGNVGPPAAFSLQALLDNSFESIFGTASWHSANNTPMRFCQLFSKGAWVVDCFLMEIKDKNVHHQSLLDGLPPLLIAKTVEHMALPIQQNVTSLHVALMALAPIMNDTLQQLEKTKLALQMLARHNDIIVDAIQHCHDEAELSIRRLIDHDVANMSAIKIQHGWLVALKLSVNKVVEEGIMTVGQLFWEVDNIKLQQLAIVVSRGTITSTKSLASARVNSTGE